MAVAPPSPGKPLFDRIVVATTEYMGPAANRFLVRQIRAHLNKDPKDITSEDVVRLTEWISAEISLFTQDSAMVENFTKDLLKVAKG